MSKLLPIIDAVSGGSGRGISYYTQGLQCARKVVLDNKAKAERAAREAEGQSLREYGKGGSAASRIGTLYHALCEQWHGKGITFEKAIPCNDLYDLEFHEAERLFKYYKKQWHNDPTYFGTAEAVELKFPRNEADEKLLAEAFQFEEPLTALLDMVIRIDNIGRARLFKEHGLVLPGAGLYVWDHKSSKAKKNTLEWDMSMQFTGYPLMYATCMDEEPLGMIAASMVRHKKLVQTEKTKSFTLHLVPWETAVKNHAAFSTMLNLSHGLIEANFPNATSCFNWGRACYHYENGTCERF